MEAQAAIGEKEIDTYEEDGLIKIRLPAVILDLRQKFLEEICLWLDHFGNFRATPETLSDDLVKIAKDDRQLVGRLYKISRRFPTTKQIASHPYFTTLAGVLMKTSLVSCCHLVNIRFDLPQESKYLLDAHQDFPYIQGSLNGLTIWLPFHDVKKDMGPPSFIIGSHRWGVLKSKEYSLAEVGGSGGRSFKIIETGRLDREKFVSEEINSDAALVFHTLLVHRSETNISERARISIQLRFDDALNQISFGKNYPEGLYLNNKLVETYPEFVEEG